MSRVARGGWLLIGLLVAAFAAEAGAKPARSGKGVDRHRATTAVQSAARAPRSPPNAPGCYTECLIAGGRSGLTWGLPARASDKGPRVSEAVTLSAQLEAAQPTAKPPLNPVGRSDDAYRLSFRMLRGGLMVAVDSAY